MTEELKELLNQRQLITDELKRASTFSNDTLNRILQSQKSLDDVIKVALQSTNELYQQVETNAKYNLKCMEAICNSFNLDPTTYGKDLLGLIDIAQDFYRSNVGEVARLKVLADISKTRMQETIEVLKECNHWMIKIDDVHSFDTQERIVSAMSELMNFINPSSGEEKKVKF